MENHLSIEEKTALDAEDFASKIVRNVHKYHEGNLDVKVLSTLSREAERDYTFSFFLTRKNETLAVLVKTPDTPLNVPIYFVKQLEKTALDEILGIAEKKEPKLKNRNVVKEYSGGFEINLNSLYSNPYILKTVPVQKAHNYFEEMHRLIETV